jgi:hypothetical protein
MIYPGLRELPVVLSRAPNFEWRIRALPYLGASFWIWQCAFVTRHFTRLVIPLSQGTSRVTRIGHSKAPDHLYLVWKSFTVPFFCGCANKFTVHAPCHFLVPMVYWKFSLAPWILLVLLSVLNSSRYLYSVDMVLHLVVVHVRFSCSFFT